ncbi:ribosome biogenesis GTP-binding protein YihA/YsxC [Pseudalkalibacillus salsuginis]|uniref:ribosome biogenesis GTP-binding protein YihA/YsxC n=1 Tax=Pseudalkalibacillus salsuginis TaxID=2910972 RepID=UPI001F008B91|nr:ribosome biogenesis GTP-binding protein YihA/YsxC [Pseudalkalibacillus salsuginis]MCF6408685.1 ribosome biogenesis GTP-binding protein YihA/YsxC [Pseudalkalibacillus salsuginis]
MKVNTAELIISAVKKEQYPNDMKPEIALAGRSNVGKSSFINKMINRKALARTSSKPGKTQTLNFYLLNEVMYFVDVPGYGFAKVSKKERDAWGRMIETYLKESKKLKAVVLLVDLRHAPTKDDQLMFDWLKHFEIPVIVVATKADKIPKGKHQQHIKQIRETLQMEKGESVHLFSAETSFGKEKVWSTIESLL